MTTPNLQIAELVANQSQPDVTLNAALRTLDAAVQLSVLSMTSSLPGSPAEGDSYILTTATGGGQNNDVAYYSGGWKFITPRNGWLAWVQDVATRYQFGIGSPSSWSEFTAGGGAAQSYGDVETLTIAGSPSGITLDLSLAGIFEVTLDQSISAITISNLEPAAANFFTLRIAQNGTGGHSVSIPASWRFPSSLGPYTPTPDPSAVDLLQGMSYDGGTTWLVSYARDYS